MLIALECRQMLGFNFGPTGYCVHKEFFCSNDDTYIIVLGLGQKIYEKQIIFAIQQRTDIKIIYQSEWCHNNYENHKDNRERRQKLIIFEKADASQSL